MRTGSESRCESQCVMYFIGDSSQRVSVSSLQPRYVCYVTKQQKYIARARSKDNGRSNRSILPELDRKIIGTSP